MTLSFKQKLLALLTGLLVAYGLLFAYFLFTAPPLTIRGDTANAQRIWIENPTAHSVTNVRIEDLQGSVYESIAVLKAGEKKSVDLGTFNRGLPVVIESNFHPAARFEMGNAANTCPIGYNVVHAPDRVRKGELFRIQLNICSHGEDEIELNLAQNHSDNLSESGAKLRPLKLAKNQCTSAAFSFTATQTGSASVQILIDCGSSFAPVPFSSTLQVID